MALTRKKRLSEEGRVVNIPVEAIAPNPAQPRQLFDSASLFELAESIARYGIIQPLSVRATPEGYELVAGERRLRAAKLAGLREVPCLVMELTDEDSSVVALLENLQRRDLDYIEEAEALSRLIREYGLSQEEAARRLSRSQSAVANKLRLLRLSPEILYSLREAGLSERHARALLRLPTETLRRRALEQMVLRKLTVAQAEEYVGDLLEGARQEAETEAALRRRSGYVIKDLRLFLNSIQRSLDIARGAGLEASCERSETEGEVTLTITVPKRPAEKPRR